MIHILRVTVLSFVVVLCIPAVADHVDTLNAILAVPDVDYMRIPPGRYRITRPVIVASNPQTIDATGVRFIVDPSFVGEAVFVVSGSGKLFAERKQWITITGLFIQGKGVSAIGILSKWTSHLTLADIVVRDLKGTGIDVVDAWDFRLRDSSIMGCGDKAGKHSALRLSSETWQDPSSSNAVWVEGCVIENSESISLECTNQINLWITNTKLHGIPIPGSTDSGTLLTLEGCNGVRVTDCLWTKAPNDISIGEKCKDVEVKGIINRVVE